jgi:hypothetical protein
LLQGYKIVEPKKVKIRFIAPTLSTETCVNVEQYGGKREVLVPLMAAVCKCETDTDSTGGNGYGQPQAVAKWCDVAIPSHFGFVW